MRDLEPGQPWHLDVEEENVRPFGFKCAQRDDTVFGFGDDLELGPKLCELVTQLLAEDLFILGDDRPWTVLRCRHAVIAALQLNARAMRIRCPVLPCRRKA